MKNDTIVENQLTNKKNNLLFNVNNCPVTATMNVIGGKWKIILINQIQTYSPARFGSLRRTLNGISQTMLTAQLRELEEAGIINRKIYAEVPPRVEYTLTELGLTLSPILQQMAGWGKKYVQSKYPDATICDL